MRKITDDAEAGHVTTRVVMNEIIRMDHAGTARSRSPLKQARKKKQNHSARRDLHANKTR